MQAGNAADPLRYAFIVSQAELVPTAEEVAAASFSKAADLEGVGPVCVGVLRAEGEKCSRCGLLWAPRPGPVCIYLHAYSLSSCCYHFPCRTRACMYHLEYAAHHQNSRRLYLPRRGAGVGTTARRWARTRHTHSCASAACPSSEAWASRCHHQTE